jgi:hypothetical protein
MLVIATLAGAAMSPWGSKKSVEELKLLNEQELAIEGAKACSEANIERKSARGYYEHKDYTFAQKGADATQAATEYLERIGLVVRQKLNTEPPWLKQLKLAAYGDGQEKQCLEAIRTVPPVRR